MQHKKFMDIQRIKTDITDNFQVGDYIVIQEKIDGANAAIRYDCETDSIIAQSRKKILDLANNLRGFWEFTQNLNKNVLKEVISNKWIIFGEWLVPHSIVYPDDKYNNFYMYDIYDTETEKYLTQNIVKSVAEKCGLNYVPVFYDGEFVSWGECMKYVGKTALGGEMGEGIVVKNQAKLNDPNTRQPFYLKIVGEKFLETKKHKVKQIDPNKLKSQEENLKIVESIITEARVVKILHKFVDEGILSENWGATEMPIVAKNLTKAVYEDCMKEEPDIVAQASNFGKVANGVCMRIARNIMSMN